MRVNLRLLNRTNIFKNKRINQNNGYIQSYSATSPFEQVKGDAFEISFGATKRCNTQNFRVKEILNLRCPVCGLIMLDEDQIAMFVKDVSPKKGVDLYNALEKYEDESTITQKPSKDKTGFGIYRPRKKEVVEVYKRLALEFPNKNMLDLTKIQAKRCIGSLIDKQLEVIEELKEYIEQNFDEEEKEKILKKIDEDYVKQIKGESGEQFARKKFIYNIKNSVNIKYKSEIERIASKMPTSENDTDSFFVKYANSAKSSSVIANKLVEQSKPTAEHVVPRALGGSDSLSNYICDCADCNTKRGTTPFYEWYQSIPGFNERLQEYLNSVSEALDSGFFKTSKDYDNYIQQIIERLTDISEGEIYLEVPEIKNPDRKIEAIEKRKNEINRVIESNNLLIGRAQQLESQIKVLEDSPLFDDIDEVREINEELERIEIRQKEIGLSLEELRKRIYAVKKEIEAIESELNKSIDPARKVLLKKELADKEEEYETLNAKMEKLLRRSQAIKKRKIIIKKQKRISSQREIEIRNRHSELGALLSKINEIIPIAQKYESLAQKEQDCISEIGQLEQFIIALKEQNASILENALISADDKKDYDDYIHQLELIRIAKHMVSNKVYEKMASKSGLAREILEIGQKTIEERLAQLSAMPQVKYFINIDAIKDKITRKTALENNLLSALEEKQECEKAKMRISELLNGRELSEVREEYAQLSDLKREIDEIYKVSQKKHLLEKLNRAIKQNNAQLKKLEDYKELTNAQYSRIMDRIELEVPDLYLYC